MEELVNKNFFLLALCGLASLAASDKEEKNTEKKEAVVVATEAPAPEETPEEKAE